LEIGFSPADYITVENDDGTRVDQLAVGEYSMFEFKDIKVAGSNLVSVLWNGQSTFPASSSQVALQVYDRDSSAWETMAINTLSAANIDFDLIGSPSGVLDNYTDSSGWMACRVHQYAGV